MNKNLDLVAKELYATIEAFPNLSMKDADENDVDVDQVESARNFTFEYEHQGRNLATVTISLEDSDQGQDHLKVLMSNNPMETQGDLAKKIFFNFKKQLREFARQHVLSFDLHDVTKSNTEKRNNGENTMSESKLFGTSMTSYQNLGNAKLIVKHSAPVNFENPAGRAQRIESIFIESEAGERFRYPFRHLNGARALAQHVAHGGTPYDNVGQYMVGLSEELNKLRMFKHYVERNDAINEAMGSITPKVLERIDQVKEQIHKLQSATRYKEFVEGFTEQVNVEIPEDVMNDWVDRLTVRSFNEELKNVFPFIFKLVSEDDIPVKELGIEDLISEDPDQEDEEPDSIIIPEFAEYEKYLNTIVEAERKDIFGAENDDLIDQLNSLLAEPMSVGVDGTNAIQSLEGIIDDKDLENAFKALSKIDPESDARDILKGFVSKKDEEFGTDVSSQLTFGDETSTPPAEPEPAEPMPVDAMPAEEPMPPEEPPADAAPPEELPMPPAAPVAEAMAREGRSRQFEELKEFIQSMYNTDEGNFPKGVEGVKIACEKKFGDRVGPIAAKIVERMTTMGEMRRIKELSGMTESDKPSMSRAAKGNEKYGKNGMKALAKAGREGASEKTLDTLRDKHDKYDEGRDLTAMLRIAGLR